eukprot:540630_1
MNSKLSTIYYDLPLVSFEELRCEHYLNEDKWKALEDTKLVILHWPQTMNRDTLRTMFGAYGRIIECDVNHDNHCCFVQYDANASALKAIEALDGFKIGDSKLTVQFLRFEPPPEPEQKEEEPIEEEQLMAEDTRLVIGNWPQSMSQGLLCTLFAPYGEITEAKIVNECAFIEYKTPSEAQAAHGALHGFQMGSNKLAITFAGSEISHILNMNHDANPPTDDTAPKEEANEAAKEEHKPLEDEENESKPDAVSIFEAQDENESQLKSNETPNERDIAQMVSKESERDIPQKEEATESSSSTEASDSDTDSSSSNLDSSDSSADSLHKSKKKKLSNKELKKLKRKKRRRKRRKMKEKKRRKKLSQRQNYVDKNITALNDCLEKFTNLMSSVSQSAMIMQQSVAQISQMHAQQQQQSMVFQHQLFPNQPMYASMFPTGATPATQPGTQPPANNSGSIQNVINQMSNTQGGPEENAKEEAAKMNAMNTDMLNEQLLEQQSAMRRANPSAWVNTNYPKPTISSKQVRVQSSDITSSPILHSTHHASPRNNATNNGNELNIMNLSGDSGSAHVEQPGNNTSKSKIFEHKKALRNVSKEMDQKLSQLNNMGYKNRTFNLVLLKQENGDMTKVVAALKQFYQSN